MEREQLWFVPYCLEPELSRNSYLIDLCYHTMSGLDTSYSKTFLVSN